MDPQSFFIRVLLGAIIAPAMAVTLYLPARLVAMAVAKWMPECALKRKLLTDTETKKLAYRPPNKMP